MRPAAVVAAAMCLHAHASVADAPLLRPNRDVDVTYRAAAANQPEHRVRWLARQILRIDPPGTGLYVIIDYMARRMSVVRVATRSVVEMAAPDSMTEVLGGKGAGSYVRHGEATVAGLGCTEWQTQDRQQRPALVCLTSDGVPLRGGTLDQTLVSAVPVTYAPQNTALFHIPEDYTVHTVRGTP